MKGFYAKALMLAAGLAMTACADTTAPNGQSADVDAALGSTLASFSETDNTFDGTDSVAWHPRGHGGRNGLMRHHGGPGYGGLMGGGLRGLLLGRAFGLLRNGFMLPPTCTFNSETGRVECPDVVHNGVTIEKSASYKTAAGVAQPAFDSLTNEVNVQVAVNGTFRSRRDSAQTTVAHASTRTLSGLGPGSTERRINGTSAGRESTVGNDTAGTYTLLRVAGDTVDGVVIPVGADRNNAVYPSAGVVIRSMAVTLTRGDVVRSSTRREALRFNGTANVPLVITHNGSTKECTLSLATWHVRCP